MEYFTSASIYFSYLNENTDIFLLSVFLLSLLVGSFLNVVIHRLPIILTNEWTSDCREFLSEQTKTEDGKEGKPVEVFNIATPRSQCPNCQHKITAIENIPIISWIFLRGRCSSCHKKISIRPQCNTWGEIKKGLI